MTMEQRLSEFLLNQVESYEMDGANRPSKQDRAARIVLGEIAEQLIEARESFSNERFSILDIELDLEKALLNEPEINEIAGRRTPCSRCRLWIAASARPCGAPRRT
jgi:hypothetical protein